MPLPNEEAAYRICTLLACCDTIKLQYVSYTLINICNL